MEKVEILIESGGRLQEPIILEGITWETARKGEPSKLTFTCVKDDFLSFSEGAAVTMLYGKTKVFKGYVFQKQRNKDHHIQVTAYDQLRYLKNKTSYRWVNGVRADQVVKQIAGDFKLKLGSIANTQYVIPKLDCPNQTLFDTILDAIDLTVMNTGKLFYLYDDFGALTLKNITESQLDLIVDKDTAEDFDYKTSIDSNTYNRIVVAEDDETAGEGVYKHADDYTNQGRWGVLQHFETGYKGANAQNKANALLKLYNQVSRTLTVNGCLGDIRARAGTSVYLDLNLGDQIAKQIMLVEHATHTFNNGHHYMDLQLSGCKEFYGQ